MKTLATFITLLFAVQFVPHESQALFTKFKKKGKHTNINRKNLVKDLKNSPLFQKRQELEKIGFDVIQPIEEIYEEAVDLDLLNSNNIVTLCKLFFGELQYTFQNEALQAKSNIENILEQILEYKNDKDKMDDMLTLHYPILSKNFDILITNIPDENLELKKLLNTIKMILCTVSNIIDIDRYYEANENEILKYKDGSIEAYINAETTFQPDVAGLVQVSGGINFSVRNGSLDGEYSKIKSTSLSVKNSLKLPNIAKVSISSKLTFSSGARYVSIRQIALSNENIANKVSNSNSVNRTDPYILFCEKLKILAKEINQLRGNLLQLQSVLKTLSIIKLYDTLSLNFKDGRYTTEFIKTLSNKTHVRIESDLLSSIGLSVSAEKKRSIHQKENEAIIKLKKQPVIISDKNYVLSFLNILGSSRIENKLLNGDYDYFKSIMAKTNIKDINTLKKHSETYLKLLNNVETTSHNGHRTNADAKSMKRNFEKNLQTLGRKDTIKRLCKLFAYFCLIGKQEHFRELNATKSSIFQLMERLHYNSSHNNKKYNLKKLKAKVTEESYTISFLDLLSFSYKSVHNDPNIENNGIQMRLNINLSMLKKLNNAEQAAKETINKIISKLKLNIKEFSTERHISDKFFMICLALHKKIEIELSNKKRKHNDTLLSALSKFKGVLLKVATDFAIIQHTPWKKELPLPLRLLLTTNSTVITLEFVKDCLEEKELIFSRAFITALQENGIAITIDNHTPSTGINIETQFKNSYENQTTIYNIIRSFLKYAREYETDKEDIKHEDACEYIRNYPFISEIINSAKSGILYESMQKYKKNDKLELFSETTNDNQIINELATIVLNYHKQIAQRHYSKIYNQNNNKKSNNLKQKRSLLSIKKHIRKDNVMNQY